MDIERLAKKIEEITECDNFEAHEAIYAYASLNHNGQTSMLYSLLSQSEFRPGPMWKESDVEGSYVYDSVSQAIILLENSEDEEYNEDDE
jgi:hypothetical protein